MARYGFNWEQTLTLETTEADRKRVIVVVAPSRALLLHRCAGYDFFYAASDNTWSWESDDEGDDIWHSITFCPHCGMNLTTLIPKE